MKRQRRMQNPFDPFLVTQVFPLLDQTSVFKLTATCKYVLRLIKNGPDFPGYVTYCLCLGHCHCSEWTVRKIKVRGWQGFRALKLNCDDDRLHKIRQSSHVTNFRLNVRMLEQPTIGSVGSSLHNLRQLTIYSKSWTPELDFSGLLKLERLILSLVRSQHTTIVIPCSLRMLQGCGWSVRNLQAASQQLERLQLWPSVTVADAVRLERHSWPKLQLLQLAVVGAIPENWTIVAPALKDLRASTKVWLHARFPNSHIESLNLVKKANTGLIGLDFRGIQSLTLGRIDVDEFAVVAKTGGASLRTLEVQCESYCFSFEDLSFPLLESLTLRAMYWNEELDLKFCNAKSFPRLQQLLVKSAMIARFAPEPPRCVRSLSIASLANSFDWDDCTLFHERLKSLNIGLDKTREAKCLNQVLVKCPKLRYLTIPVQFLHLITEAPQTCTIETYRVRTEQ